MSDCASIGKSTRFVEPIRQKVRKSSSRLQENRESVEAAFQKVGKSQCRHLENVVFPGQSSAQGSLCVFRTFGPYHQQNFERPRRISGTTNTEVSETRFSAYKNALTMRQFSLVFFEASLEQLLKSSAILNGQEFRNAKNQCQTRAYSKIFAVFNITARIRKICRKYEGLCQNYANSSNLAHYAHRIVQANVGCPGSALKLHFPTKVAPREA